jgi:phage shock protein E
MLIALVLAAVSPVQAMPANPLINYDGYSEMVSEVAPVRRDRLITLADFRTRAARPEVLILDARSTQAFAEGHIKGAVNLPLPDFTVDALAEVIGANQACEILIYCNKTSSTMSGQL